MKELERKFRASRDLVLPDLDGRIAGVVDVSAPDKLHLVATYFDTADLRLAREGITLRRRTGGDDDGWHLKLPTHDDDAREEIHALGGDDIPDQLRRAVTAYARFARLQPAATLVTDRTRWRLRAADGATLAELVDDAVTVEGVGRVSAGFREIEVEDKGGGRRLVDEVGALLRDAGAVAGEFMPKLVRALGARATAPPDPPLPPDVGPKDPARTVLTGYLRTQVRALMSEDARFRLGGEDAIHQMRVATRRIRGVLRVYAPLLDPEWSQGLRDELCWLGGGLGPARDAEVVLARLSAAIDDLPASLVIGPVRARLEQTVGAELGAAVADAERVLADERYLSLLERLVDAAWEPRTDAAADASAKAVLPDLIRGAWRKLASGVARVREGGTPGDYHRVRVAAKHLRYATEVAAPAFGKPADRLAQQIHRVQQVLGDYQDAVLAQDVLRRVAQSAAGRPVGFTLGVVHAAEQHRARSAQLDFQLTWPEVARRRYRDWLTS